MGKLVIEEDIFLKRLLIRLKQGENIEQALFNINILDTDILMHLQLGKSIKYCLSLIRFHHPAIRTLLVSASQNLLPETLERIEATAKLIETRKEATKEMETIISIHRRRIRIIQFVTTITIGILAGFAPVFLKLSEIINNSSSRIAFSLSVTPTIAISFLLINMLNSYFLMQIAGDRHKKIKIFMVVLIHLLLVVIINIFLKKTAFVQFS